MIQFIRLTTVDPSNAEHVPSLYQVSKITGFIQDDDRTFVSMGAEGDEGVVVTESVDEIQELLAGAPNGREYN